MKYHYATVKFSDLAPICKVPSPKDSYISEDETVKAVSDLLKKGYRWIRTDGEYAVFEKEMKPTAH